MQCLQHAVIDHDIPQSRDLRCHVCIDWPVYYRTANSRRVEKLCNSTFAFLQNKGYLCVHMFNLVWPEDSIFHAG